MTPRDWLAQRLMAYRPGQQGATRGPTGPTQGGTYYPAWYQGARGANVLHNPGTPVPNPPQQQQSSEPQYVVGRGAVWQRTPSGSLMPTGERALNNWTFAGGKWERGSDYKARMGK